MTQRNDRPSLTIRSRSVRRPSVGGPRDARNLERRDGAMALRNRLGGHTNSYHTYSLEEALEGIAAAGYAFVELSAVRGWTEHVPLDASAKTLGGVQRM